MAYDLRRGCPCCAWRENCAKRFSMEQGAIHCPDFTEDLLLKRQASADSPEELKNLSQKEQDA